MPEKTDLPRSVALSAQQLRRILAEPGFFQVIFDALPLQVAIKSARAESFGRFLLWNSIAEQWMGISAEEVIGRTDYDFFPREQADFFTGMDRRVVESRRPLEIPEEEIQSRSRGLRYFHTIKTPIFDESGEPMALLVVSEDITVRRQTAAELAETLQRLGDERNLFRALLDNLPVCAFAKSARPEDLGAYILWNRVMEDLHGKPAAEVLGRTSIEAFDPLTARIFAQQDADAIERREPVDIPLQEVTYARAGRRLVHSIKAPVFAADGSPLAVIGIAEDITERMRNETERSQAMEMLRQLNSRVPGALYKLVESRDGRRLFAYLSDRVEEILGVPAEDVRAESDIIGSWVLAEDRARVEERRARSRASLTPWQCDFRILRRDGRVRWLEVNSVPQADPDGITWFGFATDVTERKRSEEALRESEERWNLALAGTEAGVWDWNIRTGGLFYSKRWREMFGYGTEEPPENPRDLLLLVHEQDRDLVRRSTVDVLRRRTDLFHCEYRMRRLSGDFIWIQAHAKAHFDERGRAARLVGTLIDITDRKQVESQLVEAKITAENANRAKGDFLAMMSHEIRTPLNGVLGFADLLATTPLDARQEEYLQTIRESGSNLLHVLNDILDYSKMESGKLAIDSQPAVLPELLESAVETFRAKAAAKHLELTCEIAPSTPRTVVVDALRLRQILSNLVSNAVKFTAAGSVRVRVDPVGVPVDGNISLRFSVADTGIGVSAEDLPRLFEPFEQADVSMARRFGGTGLGLAIVHRLLAMMGGRITASSQPGAGTTFFVDLDLPIYREALAADPGILPVAAAAVLPPATLSILLVDDHAVNRRLARLMLERLGYSPAEASDGEGAVELAATTVFDVIFMDIQMPGMDGYQAARRIREIQPQVRIVALTAHAMPVDRERSTREGMYAHLTKPVRPEELREILAGCQARAFQNGAAG